MDTETLSYKQSLGDGLYVGHDGYHVILWAERDGGIHHVGLEPAVLKRFETYIKDLRAHLSSPETDPR